MKTIIIATNNDHKAAEIAGRLDFPNWEFKTLKDLGIKSDPEEDAETFLGNARIKARAAQRAAGGMAALADDSGLMVDALNGRPGVHSARFAAEDGAANSSDEENNAKLLRLLEGVSDEDRSARFVCSLVLIDEHGREISAEGFVEGRIGRESRGDNGFGYDPLFFPDAFQGKLTMAEITADQKDLISHRGAALRDLRARIVEAGL